nr:RNA-dependent RNA polymerase [Fusarium asiaticum narnavirus 1]
MDNNVVLNPQQDSCSSRKRRRRPRRRNLSSAGDIPVLPVSNPKGQVDLIMEFGSWSIPYCDAYYLTHKGLSRDGSLTPLFQYPIEVLAMCKNFTYVNGSIRGQGKALINVPPPHRLPGLSIQEFYALWAEDILRATSKMDTRDKKFRRFRRNLDVFSFMRATWDSLLTAYQLVRSRELSKFGIFLSMPDSQARNGINRFRAQLVREPLEAAKRLKSACQANRAWYFGGPPVTGRILRFAEKANAILASFSARALPPAPPDISGLEGLVQRLTSEPAQEPRDWREFCRVYINRWAPQKRVPSLYTMPSSNAALGYPRHRGGHVTGVQHLVLIGYAVAKTEFKPFSAKLPTYVHTEYVQDGTYLELLSQSLHPSTVGRGVDNLFREPWDLLEQQLPEVSGAMQHYLGLGVDYVMSRIEYLPILPIVAEEKGLKTRFPTASLTAANVIQQILRRVIDHVMTNDPRFSQALGGELDVDLKGERGPWYSQDATAATDYHAQWLTQTIYEELAEKYSVLRPYVKWFQKLFGPKKLMVNSTGETIPSGELEPSGFFERYPRAPLLDDKFFDRRKLARNPHGHATEILSIASQWIDDLNSIPGVITTTGQMMGDPTSFPPLMLHTLYAAQKVLERYPYRKCERVRRHRGLRRTDVVLRGVGDDAQKPRWTSARRALYDDIFVSLGGRLSYDKCFHHPSRSIIAEIVSEHGYPVKTLSTSVLVAPPGGSKGHVTWNLQSAAVTGDPDRPTIRFSKFLWRSSPYYYTWRLADRLGLPISADASLGGVGVPLVPKRSTTDHTAWLQYLSQQDLTSLIAGTGLAIGEKALASPLDKSARQWLRQVVKTHEQMSRAGYDLLSPDCISPEAVMRVPLADAYRAALGKVRGAEFYFRAPLCNLPHNPSVRVAVRKFQQKVRKAKRTPVRGYQATKEDLDRKKTLYFASSGGLLSGPETRRASYGLEVSGDVKSRYIAPHLRGLG